MKLRFSFLILTFFLSVATTSTTHASYTKSQKTFFKNLNKIEGWCSPEKASAMMDLIYKTHPEVCVEIGVYGGASIYPTATALKQVGKGVVYAIDPWSNEECKKGYDLNDPNAVWWSQIDLNKIYSSFLSMLKRHHLSHYCAVMRMTSAEAVSHFSDHSIDILHIDGNHSEESALLDAQLFLPKLKQGAYIWFDDANWETTHQAVAFLLESCEVDPLTPIGSPFLLLRVCL